MEVGGSYRGVHGCVLSGVCSECVLGRVCQAVWLDKRRGKVYKE